jgi:ADP-ribose pyrophosphatase
MTELYRDDHWQVILESAPMTDGRIRRVPRVKVSDSVHILALPDPQHILMIREYRPYYKAHLWMLPSGHVDKEDDPEIGAMRELREETGYRADDLQYLWSANHSERLIMTNHFFVARDLHNDPLPQDDDEEIEVHVVPIDEAVQRIHSSEKVHMASAYGVLRFLFERC